MSPRIGNPAARLIPILDIILGLGILVYILMAYVGTVGAAPALGRNRSNNDFCLACHQQEGLALKFSDKSVSVTIDPIEFGLSVHAEEGLGCTDRHSGITDYPHPKVSAKSAREFSNGMLPICGDCHQEQFEKVKDSVHQAAADAGKTEAAICTDCHKIHTQQRLTGKISGELTNRARLNFSRHCRSSHST